MRGYNQKYHTDDTDTNMRSSNSRSTVNSNANGNASNNNSTNAIVMPASSSSATPVHVRRVSLLLTSLANEVVSSSDTVAKDDVRRNSTASSGSNNSVSHHRSNFSGSNSREMPGLPAPPHQPASSPGSGTATPRVRRCSVGELAVAATTTPTAAVSPHLGIVGGRVPMSPHVSLTTPVLSPTRSQHLLQERRGSGGGSTHSAASAGSPIGSERGIEGGIRAIENDGEADFHTSLSRRLSVSGTGSSPRHSCSASIGAGSSRPPLPAMSQPLPPVALPRVAQSQPPSPHVLLRGSPGATKARREEEKQQQHSQQQQQQQPSQPAPLTRFSSTSDVLYTLRTNTPTSTSGTATANSKEEKGKMNGHEEVPELVHQLYRDVVTAKPQEPLPFIIDLLRNGPPAPSPAPQAQSSAASNPHNTSTSQGNGISSSDIHNVQQQQQQQQQHRSSLSSCGSMPASSSSSSSPRKEMESLQYLAKEGGGDSITKMDSSARSSTTTGKPPRPVQQQPERQHKGKVRTQQYRKLVINQPSAHLQQRLSIASLTDGNGSSGIGQQQQQTSSNLAQSPGPQRLVRSMDNEDESQSLLSTHTHQGGGAPSILQSSPLTAGIPNTFPDFMASATLFTSPSAISLSSPGFAYSSASGGGTPGLSGAITLHVSRPPSVLRQATGSNHSTIILSRGSNQGTPYVRQGPPTFNMSGIARHQSVNSSGVLLERQESSRSEMSSLFSVASVDLSEFLQEFRITKDAVVGSERDCVTLIELSEILEHINFPIPEVQVLSDLFDELSAPFGRQQQQQQCSSNSPSPYSRQHRGAVGDGTTTSGSTHAAGITGVPADSANIPPSSSVVTTAPVRKVDHTSAMRTSVADGPAAASGGSGARGGEGGAVMGNYDNNEKERSSGEQDEGEEEEGGIGSGFAHAGSSQASLESSCTEEPVVKFETFLACMAFKIQGRYPAEVIRSAFFSLVEDDHNADMLLTPAAPQLWLDTNSSQTVMGFAQPCTNTEGTGSDVTSTVSGPSRTMPVNRTSLPSTSRRFSAGSAASPMVGLDGSSANGDGLTGTTTTDAMNASSLPSGRSCAGTAGVLAAAAAFSGTSTSMFCPAAPANFSHLVSTVPLRFCLTEGIQNYLGFRNFEGIDIQAALRLAGIPDDDLNWGCHLVDFIKLVNALTTLLNGGMLSGTGSSPATVMLSSSRRESQGVRGSVGSSW